MELEKLKTALQQAWCKETCYRPMQNEWSPKNPAFGQCWASALVVRDYLGGDIMRGVFDDGTSHYWNKIAGKEIDLTRSQFDVSENMPKGSPVSEEKLRKDMSIELYKKRYELLKEKVKKIISSQTPSV